MANAKLSRVPAIRRSIGPLGARAWRNGAPALLVCPTMFPTSIRRAGGASRRLSGSRVLSRLTTAALTTALLVAGCGGSDSETTPTADDVPKHSVAVVGDEEISRRDLEREIKAMGAGEGPAARPAAGTTSQGAPAAVRDGAARRAPEQVERQALSRLLEVRAIEQEAMERGIRVSDAEIRRRWRAVTKRQFRSRRALRRFLDGQSVRHGLRQLRMQELVQRIHDQVRRQAGGGRAGERAVEEFQREFRRRWADRTACAEGVSATGCG